MNRSDTELIRRAREGENDAFAVLWHRYEPQVLALCRRYLAGGAVDPVVDPADIATETFIRALHALDRYEDRTATGVGFDTWLLEIAKRLCLKVRERFRRRQQWHSGLSLELWEEQTGQAPPLLAVVEERELLQSVAEAINALPPLYRQPFKLFLEEYSHKEIAALLGIRVETAMQRIHRARRQLQPRLAPLLELAVAERALTEIVHDSRIITVALLGGGELQLCLRVESRLVTQKAQEAELVTRRRQLQRHPRAWKPFLEFAQFCYRAGHWKEARDAYQETLQRNPACFSAALALGAILRQSQRTAEALAVFKAALSQAPPPEYAARLRAEWLAEKGEQEAAATAYHEAIALAPHEREGYYGLHRALAHLSQYEQQLENLAQLRELAPDDIFSYDEAYLPCARLQRWALAEALLEKAVELDPNYPLAIKHLFQVRMNQHRFDSETLALAERLVRLAPDFVDSWSELAWIYDELGREEESIAVLQQFLSEHPSNAAAHAALSWRYHYQEKHEECAAYALSAYKLAPQNWHVCWTLITACYITTAAISEAERFACTEEIAGRFPQDAFLLNQICRFYIQWSKRDQALHYAQKLQALQPKNSNFQHLPAEIALRCGHREEAVREYSRLMALFPDRNPMLLASLGAAQFTLDPSEAEALFAEAESRMQTWQDLLSLLNLYHRYGHCARLRSIAQRLLAAPGCSLTIRRYVQLRLQDC